MPNEDADYVQPEVEGLRRDLEPLRRTVYGLEERLTHLESTLRAAPPRAVS